MTVYKVTYEGQWYVDSSLGNCMDMISDLDTGDSITLTKLDMDEKEYKELPEFEGF